MICQYHLACFYIEYVELMLETDNLTANLHSISIITAFPLSFILAAIVVSFLKDAGNFLKKRSDS